MTTALFIGRFQPFHNGHLSVVKQLSQEYDTVIIGIGSASAKYSKENPWTLEEREDMIRAVLKDENITNYTIVPIPDFPEDEEWVQHILSTIEFDDVYSGNEWTKQLFMTADCHVCEVKIFDNISATEIREKLENHESIKDLVPKKVFDEISPL